MSHRNHGNHGNIDLWSMKSAEEGLFDRAACAEGTFCDFCEFLCDKKKKTKKEFE